MTITAILATNRPCYRQIDIDKKFPDRPITGGYISKEGISKEIVGIPEIQVIKRSTKVPHRLVLLLNHERERIIGSAVNLHLMEPEHGTFELRGELVFADTPEAQAVKKMVVAGHLRGLSIGSNPFGERVYIDRNAEHRIAGELYTGPCVIVPEPCWYEVSLTPIPADDACRILRIEGEA